MKVLIIGLGSIAKKHIAAIRKFDEDIHIAALRRTKDADRIDGVHNLTLSDIKSFDDFDFVIIANPTAEHIHTLNLLKDAQVSLFIEKPLFSSITTAEEELVEAIAATTRKTYIACNLRFLRSIQELKAIIGNKRINEVNVYCGSYLPDWRPQADFRKVYSANKEMGGGVHIDLIHELDYVYWLFGEPNNTHSFFANKSSLGISAYDYANYLWGYDTFTVNIVLNYYRRDSKRVIEILTDESTYEVDLLLNTLKKNKQEIFASDQRIKDTYDDQIVFFMEEVLMKNKAFNTISEAYKILNLCMKD